MNKKITNKMIKFFYGIEGLLDEYKKTQLDKFGNIAFIITWWYLLISGFVAMLLYVNNPKIAAIFLIAGNLLISALALFSIIYFLRKKKLDIVEVDKRAYPEKKKKYFRKSIGLAVYFGVAIHILNAISDAVIQNENFWTSISSVSNICTAVFEGIAFGVCMYIVYLLRLKK
ncbi:DUF3278 domain-containing protein [Ligilactobacillus sp. WILCCON 0076]|uniref:DUF3278 domain-containing protein n=1 Tax=Ligilactobacillus ubinensis TaxID=2876789 RepID=A0A9X2FGF5_9LACO|nr:DUF3278 domain-containing protein [Ligilactobacillus ubinensis]MCP0885934.1 DUF3278 domain-containing protein [Ligilactobacillus ubinensis]